MMLFLALANVFLLLQCTQVDSLQSSIVELKKYNISDVSVSGFSSGGFMAVQLHVAYSATIKGAAIFAGKFIIEIVVF